MGKIGFTGTRVGVTPRQYATLREVLISLLSGPDSSFHHGDCVGADTHCHHLVKKYTSARIVGHPPDRAVLRAFNHCDSLMQELPYPVRNRNIVDTTDEMVAAPEGPEQQRSGTWSTVRYAVRKGRKVTIVWSDGSIEIRGR